VARRIVKVPDIGEGTTEAEIVAWHVKIGDVITEEDPLAEVMTDKATVEIPSPVAGKVIAINGKVGEKLAVGSELVVLETDADAPDIRAPAAHPPAAAASRGTGEGIAPHPNPLPVIPGSSPGRERESADAKTPRPVYREREGPAPKAWEGEGQPRAPGSLRPSGLSGAKPLASPAVRQRAWDRGVELQFVPGTGSGGRITQDDLDAYIAGGGRATAAPSAILAKRDGVEDIQITGLRRAIAEHLQEAARRIPHFAYVEEIDVTALEELRAHLNETRGNQTRDGQTKDGHGHLTVLPFLMRAIINSIVDHPQVNARFDDEAGVLHRHRAAHIGVATQTPGGLVVPVVYHAEALDLWQAAAEVQRLSEAARTGKATRDELTGSTITITSLGPLGGLVATPIINRPEVAIVGVNRIDERPVVRGGQIVVRKMMNLSSSFDHRIVDGWEAASFIAKVKGYLEHPATLFID
jgi:2-oxoisovalerate dehydrogenase E2 component (dihydrolipoyl transacylase)